MRTFGAAIALAGCMLLSSCIGERTTPSPSPAPAGSPTAGPTPTVAPSATPRQVRPFARVVALPLPADTTAAADRERIAFTDVSGIHLLEVSTGQRRLLSAATPPWSMELSPRGLRGDTLAFIQTRTDGQRTDGRLVRIDLRTNSATTLDEWSGPFLGSGDTWRPLPPVTNGREVAWVRVTDDARQFAVQVMLATGNASPRMIWSGTSPSWIDVHDSGRVAISTLITPRDRAELAYWTAGSVTSAADRPSPDGGPVLFVGDQVFWGIGPRIVRNVTRGELVGPGGERRPVDLQDCAWTGALDRYLHLICGTGSATTAVLFDPLGGARETIPTSYLLAGAGAAIWREGTQWWLGTLAQ